jgi:5-methylthioadenosine/S-adenosylhomocysteine deaminase
MHRPRAVILVALVTCAALLHAQAPAPPPVDLLITGGTVITMDPARRVLTPGAVAIGGADIVAVGSPDELRQAYTPVRVIDAT